MDEPPDRSQIYVDIYREYYDEDTLYKVERALRRAGLGRNEASNAIADMQNNGVLFRERKQL